MEIFGIPAEWIFLSLGIIGTITGVASIILHYIKFRREKPNLQIEINRCFHEFISDLSVIGTDLYLDFLVRNVGDRGTQIYSIEVSFARNLQIYHGVDKWLLDHPEFVEAHTVKKFHPSFFFENLKVNKETLDCNFTLRHTHGKKAFQAKSQPVTC